MSMTSHAAELRIRPARLDFSIRGCKALQDARPRHVALPLSVRRRHQRVFLSSRACVQCYKKSGQQLGALSLATSEMSAMVFSQGFSKVDLLLLQPRGPISCLLHVARQVHHNALQRTGCLQHALVGCGAHMYIMPDSRP